MRLNYVLTILLAVGLLIGCKSKKATVKKTQKSDNEVVVINTDRPILVKKSTVKNSTITYIEEFKGAAMEEMRMFKIPASITLAQGILESSSGNSELTRNSNNHFGIKCHKGWKGKRIYHDDDKRGECFRVYKDPRTSFRDHSLFLTGRQRYQKLFKLKKGDYVRWAKGLSEAGYATDRRYPAKLIALIEKYELHKFDTLVLGKPFKNKTVVKPMTHVVIKGDTLYSISKKYGLSVEELKKINGLNSNDISIGQKLNLVK